MTTNQIQEALDAARRIAALVRECPNRLAHEGIIGDSPKLDTCVRPGCNHGTVPVADWARRTCYHNDVECPQWAEEEECRGYHPLPVPELAQAFQQQEGFREWVIYQYRFSGWLSLKQVVDDFCDPERCVLLGEQWLGETQHAV